MINDLLNFLAGDVGLIVIGLAAALTVLVWEWRTAVVGVLFVQVGLAAVAVVHHDVALEWLYVQTGVLALSCMILALSARQTRAVGSMYHAGAWPLRMATLILAFFCWQLLAANISLPVLRPEETRLVVWLALIGVLMMGLGDSPFFTGMGLILWLTLVQVGADVLLSIPALIAMIGMLELALALACSYLILVERVPDAIAAPVMTDITFPDESPLPLPRREDMPDTPVEWSAQEILPAFPAPQRMPARPRIQPNVGSAALRARLFGRMLPARRRP
jgi:hypothetical protein